MNIHQGLNEQTESLENFRQTEAKMEQLKKDLQEEFELKLLKATQETQLKDKESKQLIIGTFYSFIKILLSGMLHVF